MDITILLQYCIKFVEFDQCKGLFKKKTNRHLQKPLLIPNRLVLQNEVRQR